MSQLRAYCAAQNVPMREPFFRFIVRDLLHRAALYCMTPEETEAVGVQLGLPSCASSLSLDRTCQWLTSLTGHLMDAPMGVMGLRLKHGVMQSVFLNTRLSELFGYSKDEFLYLILTSYGVRGLSGSSIRSASDRTDGGCPCVCVSACLRVCAHVYMCTCMYMCCAWWWGRM